MYTRNKEENPRWERGGLSSHVLLQRGDPPEADFTVTWVEVAARARQKPYVRPSEKVYVLTAGRGRMLVGEEEREVGAGDLVYVPSGDARSKCGSRLRHWTTSAQGMNASVG